MAIAAIISGKTLIQILSVVLIIMGWAIKYWMNRRKFYRRNAAGIEGFKSYEKMRLTVLLENLGWLIGNILITIGILAFLLTFVMPLGHHKSVGHNRFKPITLSLGQTASLFYCCYHSFYRKKLWQQEAQKWSAIPYRNSPTN